MGSVCRKAPGERPVLLGVRAQPALRRRPVEDGKVRAAAKMVYYRETEGLPLLFGKDGQWTIEIARRDGWRTLR